MSLNLPHLDIQIFYSINALAGRWPELDALMKWLSRPDTFLVPGTLALAFWIWRQRRQALISALVLTVLIFGMDSISFGVKQMVARQRPCRVLPDAKQVVGCGLAFGFPSNHSVNTAAAGVFLQMLYPSTGYIVWPLVALIGFSRVYVGSHYPSDVLGGWLLGGTGGWTAAFLFRKRRTRSTDSKQAVAQSPSR